MLKGVIDVYIAEAKGEHRFGLAPPNQTKRELSRMLDRLENHCDDYE